MQFIIFLCRFQVWNCIDRCNVSHVYAILKCETLSFDVIWNKIILLWVHALLRDPLRGGRGDFTEIKFDQIRSRCDKFGDFFAKILRFEGFPRFSLSCRRRWVWVWVWCLMFDVWVWVWCLSLSLSLRPFDAEWRFILELFCILVWLNFCEAFWRRMKVQFELFYAGWLPASPPTFENKCKFLTYLGSVSPWIFSFYENGPSKKNFPLRGPGFGGGSLRSQRARGAREAREAREARYVSLYLLWPCLYCFPKDSTFLRVFAHSTRASGVVIFNKNFATFQVSKTINKMGVFLHSTRSSEGVLF